MQSQPRIVARSQQYIIYDNGLKFQWNAITVLERADTTASFLTPFVDANTVHIYFGGWANASVNQNTTFFTQNRTTTNFVIRNVTESAGKGTTTCFWLAIGY